MGADFLLTREKQGETGAARGFAAGLASRGLGTARAFHVDPVAGVFAGLAMGLNAVVTPALVPALLPWLMG